MMMFLVLGAFEWGKERLHDKAFVHSSRKEIISEAVLLIDTKP